MSRGSVHALPVGVELVMPSHVDGAAEWLARRAPVLLDGQVLQPRAVARRVVDEANRRDVRLDDVDLLQRRDDQQLQAEPAEQVERKPGGLVGAAAERLVDDDEPEGLGAVGAPAPA